MFKYNNNEIKKLSVKAYLFRDSEILFNIMTKLDNMCKFLRRSVLYALMRL
jgi:hypothetical protein